MAFFGEAASIHLHVTTIGMLEYDNPYRSPNPDQSRAMGVSPQGNARLLESRWLYRRIEFLSEQLVTIEYNGRHLGYECVAVNGIVAARSKFARLEITWVAPKIEFQLQFGKATVPALVEVRLRPWLTISRFRLVVNGVVAYQEGIW
jgi:hypothetical protein